MKLITPLQFVVPVLLLLSPTKAELETAGDKMFRSLGSKIDFSIFQKKLTIGPSALAGPSRTQ